MVAGIRPALPFGCIQVAGIRDLEEAEMLVRSKVHLLGFPFGLSVHAEDTTVENAAAIIKTLPAGVLSILITYLASPPELLPLARKLGVQGVQFHGPVPVDAVRRLRAARPDLLLLKGLIVGAPAPEELLQAMNRYAPYVDGYLTDTLDRTTGAEGATGKVHDWSVSRFLAERSPHPLLLAGGLTPENVVRAVKEVSPYGVDAHTGLEGPDGRKDPDKVRDFVNNASAAFADRSTAHRAIRS